MKIHLIPGKEDFYCFVPKSHRKILLVKIPIFAKNWLPAVIEFEIGVLHSGVINSKRHFLINEEGNSGLIEDFCLQPEEDILDISIRPVRESYEMWGRSAVGLELLYTLI